ncbi:MAG: sigma 54-interacting transcriptional regulator [Desulfuromonadaceae bacterium]|nr:sigma 54-interacting transcriptional regulator [Desulfuromonadaceae bacterium]MDD5106733.1 sigma 54-interacting transcriptional regulator [Desulfuromonadaceae bacterium]
MEQREACGQQECQKMILDSIPDGIFTVDPEMRITTFNRAAEEITGFRASEAVGRFCHEILRTRVCLSACPLKEAQANGEAVVNREMDILDKENRKVPVSVNASVLRNTQGQAVGGVETFRDLSPIFKLKRGIKEKYSFRDLISRNPAMRRLFDLLPDVAATEATVLLNGDSGTGKELFTRAIHDLSPRREGPLVVVNCGALPEQLLESEIFGSRKGSYTGSVENRPGRLEMARGGTLFLDEIGDMPLPLQVKLLRVIENKEYQPLGAKSPLTADVRFVTATHRDLEEMVAEGSFRRDLFFRINVVQFKIPALQERTEDIPLLIDMALDRFNGRYAKKIRGFSSEAINALLHHHYPGNVRELLNIVEQAVILCRDGEIGVDLLPHSVFSYDHGQDQEQEIWRSAPAAAPQVNRETLEQLLVRHSGNRTQVARELGVDRTTLWRWMKKNGLDTP